jgi:hypothetical protein
MAGVARSLPRLLLISAAMLAVLVPAPMVGATAPPDTSVSSSSSAPPDTINDFIPEDVDLGDCISALPRPECGTDSKGDWRFYVVMGVMLAGMGFIAWRITKGVRARDRAMMPDPQPSTPADDLAPK